MPSRWCFRLALIATCLVVCLKQVSALSAEYCSNINTASTNKNSSIYQSNGLCQVFCQPSYAFAVVQDDGCWCSNYVPGSMTSGCSLPCPGYPDEKCGGNGLYGYVALGKAPAGTKGGISAVPESTERQSSTAVQVTVTATPNAVTVTAEASSSQAPSSSPTSSTAIAPATTITPTIFQSSASPSSASSSSSSSSLTWTPTPTVSLETLPGSIRTVTITPTVPPNSQNIAPVSKSNSGGLSTGGAVGLTIGLVAVVAIISGIVFVCIKKHRQEKEAEAYNDISRRGSSAGLGGPVPSRTMSENSRYVLGTNGRDVVETWEPDENGPPGSRRSRLMPVDPRLDPFAPVYQLGQNKSRESVNTIRDDHDYSRRVHQQGPILRATNPDE